MKSSNFLSETKILKKGGHPNAEVIWRAFEAENGEQSVSYFCNQIFEMLLTTTKGTNYNENQQKMLATLMVLQFYKNKKLKSEDVILNCNKLLELRKSGIFSHGKLVLYLFLRPNNNLDDFIQYFISRLFFCPQVIKWDQDIAQQLEDEVDEGNNYAHQLMSNEPEKTHECLQRISFPQSIEVETKILSFGMTIFEDFIRYNSNFVSRELYEHMRQILKAHVHGMSSKRQITKHYLVQLINFIIMNITLHGCTQEDILKDFLIWANQLRNLPTSLGQFASDFFNMLHMQIKCPGYSFRKKLRADFPSLDIKESVFINKQCYFVSNIDDCFSCPEYCSLINLRKLIILHIIKVSLSAQSYENSHKMVRILSQMDTYNLYFKLMRILEISAGLEVYDKIKKVQKQSIEQLLNRVQQQFQQDETKKVASEIEMEEFDALTKNDHPMGIFQYPTQQIIHVPLANFVSTKAEYCFASIVKKNKAEFPMLNFYRNKIPIIFHGDGYDFTKLIRTIAEYIEKTQIENTRQIRVYFIPIPYSTNKIGVSLYLASKDIWYRRFIFSPFREKMIYPSIDLDRHTKDIFPSYLYNKAVQMYLREAKRTFPMRIYKCHLRMYDEPEDETRYFCSYFSMGTFTEAEILKMTKEKDKEKLKKYVNMDVIEIINEKIKKFPPMILSLYIEGVESIDKNVVNKAEKNLKVDDIQICNFPKEYFMGNEPDPTSEYLQMTILTEAAGKIFRREINNKENFKRKQAEIKEAFRELFISKSIKSVTIENLSKDQSLKVMIDGYATNRIQKIRIEPAVTKSGLPVIIPIQSFVPFK